MPEATEMPRGLLFDMDGVLYNADRLIAGAVETVSWVQERGIPHLFLTNTTSRCRAALSEKLLAFGIRATETEILTPAAVAAEWLRTDCEGPIALFVRPSARREFADLPYLPDSAEQGAAYVVVGDLGDLWDYRTLNRAFRLLHHNPEAKLIALGLTVTGWLRTAYRWTWHRLWQRWSVPPGERRSCSASRQRASFWRRPGDLASRPVRSS